MSQAETNCSTELPAGAPTGAPADATTTPTTRIPGPSASSRTYTPVYVTEVNQGQEAIRNATSYLRARKARIARWEASGPENMTSPGQVRVGSVYYTFNADGTWRSALRSLGTGEVESRQYRFQNEVRRQRKALKNVEEVEITERYITVNAHLAPDLPLRTRREKFLVYDDEEPVAPKHKTEAKNVTAKTSDVQGGNGADIIDTSATPANGRSAIPTEVLVTSDIVTPREDNRGKPTRIQVFAGDSGPTKRETTSRNVRASVPQEGAENATRVFKKPPFFEVIPGNDNSPINAYLRGLKARSEPKKTVSVGTLNNDLFRPAFAGVSKLDIEIGRAPGTSSRRSGLGNRARNAVLRTIADATAPGAKVAGPAVNATATVAPNENNGVDPEIQRLNDYVAQYTASVGGMVLKGQNYTMGSMR